MTADANETIAHIDEVRGIPHYSYPVALSAITATNADHVNFLVFVNFVNVISTLD
ncbi:MAG: hypothetical protein FIO04_03965 [Nitrosopumilales archaeon]|nr:hypothetical protein [Nitrosopumilales archaeon]